MSILGSYAIYAAFLSAPSKGQYFNASVKGAVSRQAHTVNSIGTVERNEPAGQSEGRAVEVEAQSQSGE